MLFSALYLDLNYLSRNLFFSFIKASLKHGYFDHPSFTNMLKGACSCRKFMQDGKLAIHAPTGQKNERKSVLVKETE